MSYRRSTPTAVIRSAVVLTAVTAIGGLAGCAPATSSATAQVASSPTAAASTTSSVPTTSRLDTVKASGRLRVCTTGDYRPFTYRDPRTKTYSGIDVKMATDLATSLKVKIAWVPTTWKTLMSDTTRSCDIAMGGISVTTDRAAQAFFSEPLLAEGKTPITLCRNVAKYDTVAEINRAGVRSITPIGGTNEIFATKNYPRGTIIRWKDNNTIFDEIIAGRADVMTTDASETVWVAKTHPQLCAVHPDKPFDYSAKAYLLPRGDIVFKEYVDTWLTIAKKDGTYAAATRPWFGSKPL